MKSIIRAVSLLGIASFSTAVTRSSAQQSATSYTQVYTTVVTPVSIARASDMVFDNTAMASSGHTVVVPGAGAHAKSRNNTDAISMGTAGVASFRVSGQPGYVYAIALPRSITINDGAARTMTVNNLVSSAAASGGTLISSGEQTVYVGGTLTFTNSQTPGAGSTTTPFDVIVVYN